MQDTRRGFIKSTAALGLGYWAAGGASRADSTSAGEKVNIACVGVGGKGGSDTNNAAEHGNIVALCDCDEGTLGKMGEKYPMAKKYTDFRKMLEEMGKSIDAVTVSTPDHTHAPASVMAMRMGKHVYCQKPLTHTVHEARLMAQLAKEKKLSTQMGNQGTADDGFRSGVEIIRSGAIGTVKEVHVWTNRPIWPQAPDVVSRPAYEDPVPANLNWDAFIGPAPMRPYVAKHREGPAKGKGVYHTFAWRGWWDFGTGALGDMGCHTMNMAFMALKLTHPTSIEAEAGDVNSETCPSFATIRYEFPANGDRPPVKVVWYEGKINGQKNLPPLDLLQGEAPVGSGLLLVGDKGSAYSPNDYGARIVLLPKASFMGYQPPAATLPRQGGGNNDSYMKKEWIAAIKGGPEPMSNFGYAGLLTETLLLGNVAIRAGKKLAWDGPNFKITNDASANQLLHKPYREGWKL